MMAHQTPFARRQEQPGPSHRQYERNSAVLIAAFIGLGLLQFISERSTLTTFLPETRSSMSYSKIPDISATRRAERVAIATVENDTVALADTKLPKENDVALHESVEMRSLPSDTSATNINSEPSALLPSSFLNNSNLVDMKETTDASTNHSKYPQEIDYDSYWKTAMAIASSSDTRPFNVTAEFSCPKVYVYDNLPPNLVDSSDKDGFNKRLPMMDKVDKSYKNHLYETNQYAFPSILQLRLMNDYPCRTKDPNEADLFYAPILPAAKYQIVWRKRCANVSGTDVENALTFLNETNGCRHFFAVGKAHHELNMCRGWWNRPVDHLMAVQRLAYSEIGYDNLRNGKNSWHVYSQEKQKSITFEYPNLHSVPYPSNLHFRSSVPASAMAPFQNMDKRESLMSFIGRYTHGDLSTRRLIQKQCLAYNDKRVCHFRKYHLSLMAIKSTSTFCLEPAGDTPWRKGISDSILFGCIPVFFSDLTDDVAPWFWDDWKTRGRVLVNRKDFINGKIDLKRLLESIPPSFLKLMQTTLAEKARQFQYSLDNDEGDGISLVLERLHRQAKKMQDENKCGY